VAQLIRVVAFLTLCLTVFGLAHGNGVAPTSERPKAKADERRCDPCICSTPVTVNCQQPSGVTASPSSGTQSTNDVQVEDKNDAGELASWLSFIETLAWQLLLLFLIWYVGRDVLIGLVKSLSKVKGPGIELEFDREGAKEVKGLFQGAFKDFMAAAQKEYDRQSEIHQLSELRLPAAVAAVKSKLKTLPKGYRATVHVPDVVFKRFLYQLVDYYPGGGGRGRRFSERYGIIGRSWRLKESIGEGNALRVADPLETANTDPEKIIRTLIEEWGMTRAEAENSTRSRPSVLCVVLFSVEHNTKVPVGILFMDSEKQDAFGVGSNGSTDMARQLEADPAVRALAQAIAPMMEDLRKGETNLEVV
jgi:hypothetical protein